MRRIKLTGLLARIGGEVADEILVDKAKHIVVLAPIHRNVLDEVDEITSSLGPTPCVGAKLGETGLQRVEDAVEDALAGGVDITVKG